MTRASVMGVAITLVALGACKGSSTTSADQRQAVAPEKKGSSAPPTPIAEPRGKVVFQLATGKKEVSVEVVKSDSAVQKGLMYRQYMAADAGMLFLMGETRIHVFWMQNTLIPLDMLFITDKFEIAGIVENATPQTEDPRRVDKESLYVLEVNGGWCKANGVTAGMKVEFVDVDKVAR